MREIIEPTPLPASPFVLPADCAPWFAKEPSCGKIMQGITTKTQIAAVIIFERVRLLIAKRFLLPCEIIALA